MSARSTLDPARKSAGPPPLAAGSLKRRVVGGATWLLVGNGAERALRFLRMAVLARLLSPEDFGLMGLITMVIGFFDALTFTATNQAIIQHPSGRSREFLNTVFTVALVRGLSISLLVFLGAPWVAAFFVEPNLTPMIRLAALTPLMMAMTNPAVQLLLKDLDFRRWSVYVVVSNAVSVLLTLALGLWLRNAWALVLGSIADQVVLTGLSYFVSGYRPVPRWDQSSGRELIAFTRKALGIPLIVGCLLQAPNVLLGKLADTATLGAFLLALNLADVPTHIVTRVVALAGLPAYSSIASDPERLRRAWRRGTLTAVGIMLPVLVGMAIWADVALRLAYGSIYSAQTTVLRVLCWYGFMRLIVMTSGPLNWALGRPNADRTAFLISLAVAYGPGALLVKQYGAVGMALGWAAAWTVAAVVEWGACLRNLAVRASGATTSPPPADDDGYRPDPARAGSV